jgi:hypothetical protein
LSNGILLINTLTNGIFMLVLELLEDSWSGPNNSWHNQGQDDQWYNGNDEWHGSQSGNMIEDLAVANLVTTESSLADVVTARDLIGRALQDPLNEKHKYFEFLKYLRTKRDKEYSTNIHQRACILALTKDQD